MHFTRLSHAFHTFASGSDRKLFKVSNGELTEFYKTDRILKRILPTRYHVNVSPITTNSVENLAQNFLKIVKSFLTEKDRVFFSSHIPVPRSLCLHALWSPSCDGKPVLCCSEQETPPFS